MNEETKAKLKDIFEWIYCIVIAVVLALLIRYYVGTPTIVKQRSMYPTLELLMKCLKEEILLHLKHLA